MSGNVISIGETERSAAAAYPEGYAAGELGLRALAAPGGVGVAGYDVVLTPPGADERAILARLPAAELPGALARLLNAYRERRAHGESFAAFARRHQDTALGALLVGVA